MVTQQRLEDAVTQEREACARIALSHRAPELTPDILRDATPEARIEICAEARGEQIAAKHIASKIRARRTFTPNDATDPGRS